MYITQMFPIRSYCFMSQYISMCVMGDCIKCPCVVIHNIMSQFWCSISAHCIIIIVTVQKPILYNILVTVAINHQPSILCSQFVNFFFFFVFHFVSDHKILLELFRCIPITQLLSQLSRINPVFMIFSLISIQLNKSNRSNEGAL